ncbi:MAG: FG-GAP-like repeat-containing protein, partial [Patescibacteria group bacterium]
LDSEFKPLKDVLADGNSTVRIGVKLLVGGNVAKGYNGPVEFKVATKKLCDPSNKIPKKMTAGELHAANAIFKSSKTSGEAEIFIDIPGFISDTAKFKTKADEGERIELSADGKSLYTNSGNEVTLQAKLLDRYGNLVDYDNSTVIDFVATDATKQLVNFSLPKATAVNGIATTKVIGAGNSGTVNILAKANKVHAGAVSLQVNKHVTSDEVKEFSPRALYIALLGGTFGATDCKTGFGDCLAQSLLFSKGQVQAISALTSSVKDKKRLFGVDGYGKIEIMSETVSSEVTPATNSFPYQKVIFSDNFNNVELASLFVVPKTGTSLKLLQSEEEKQNGDGIFVQSLLKDGAASGESGEGEDDGDSKTGDDGNAVKFTEKSDGIYLEKGSETKVKIDLFGRIFLNDKNYKLRLLTKEDGKKFDGFSLMISDDKEDLAVVFYNQDFGQNVKQIAYNSSINAFFPGIYVQPASTSQKYTLIKSLSRSSDIEPKGFYLLDTETNIDESQMAGFGYTSLENAGDKFGVGYSGDNKQMLLFASGNSIGESSLPYASDSGIVYGDPMIRLKVDNDLISQKSGYSKGFGKAIFSSPENIQELISFDFNGDSSDDLLLVYENGLVRLLENEISNKRFKDRGYILNIVNGIFSLAKIDVNNDGFDDLVVGTKESCKADEECVNLVTNYNGQLVTTPLNLALNKRKIYEMKAYDMDEDGCEDLVTSDSSGTISIFYNQIKDDDCKGLNTTPAVSKNFGFSFEEGKDLSESLFVNYTGMEEPDGKDVSLDPSSNSYKFAQFILQKKELTKEPSKTSNFIFIKEDGKFSGSKKQAIDENGGVLELNDKVNFLITLQNSGNKNAYNVMISDSAPATMTIDLNSLKCLDQDCPDKLEWSETGASLRSHVIGNVSVPKNGKRTITYSATINQMPEIGFDVGKDFGDYLKDDYYDLLIKPQVNPEKVVTYFYSTGKKKYSVKTAVPEAKTTSDDILAKAFENAGLPDPASMMAASQTTQNDQIDIAALMKKDLKKEKVKVNMSDEDKEKVGNFSGKINEDKDYSGCTDSWDNLLASQADTSKAVAAFVENSISALQCSGAGCLPIPYNYAFFAPDYAMPGIAVFAVIP